MSQYLQLVTRLDAGSPVRATGLLHHQSSSRRLVLLNEAKSSTVTTGWQHIYHSALIKPRQMSEMDSTAVQSPSVLTWNMFFVFCFFFGNFFCILQVVHRLPLVGMYQSYSRWHWQSLASRCPIARIKSEISRCFSETIYLSLTTDEPGLYNCQFVIVS